MIIQWGILIVLILILLVLIYFCIRSSPKEDIKVVAAEEPQSLKIIASIMQEEKEEKERQQKDDELIAYAKSKYKSSPPNPIQVSRDQSDRAPRVKSHELVGYQWSELEKQIWEEFNSDN